MNRKTVSPSHDDRKSIDSKRGIFTSKNVPEEKPSVIPYLNTSLQGIRESLDDIKNINSSFQIEKNIQIQNGNNQRSTSPINTNYQVYHTYNNQPHPNIGPIHNINFQEVYTRSTTPPKVKFNYATQNSYLGQQTVIQNTTSNQNIPMQQNSQQHINYVPIIEGPQIKRTFVPMEIKNEVPAKIIINSLNQTPPYRNFEGTQTIHQKDEAYQILIKEYEKLYAALMKQTEKNKHLQILIEKKNAQSSHQIIEKPAPYSDQNYRNQRQQESQKKKIRKLSLDVEELHNLLAKIYQKSVKDVINSRKQTAKSKIAELFESAKKQINNVSFQSVERTFTYQRI